MGASEPTMQHVPAAQIATDANGAGLSADWLAGPFRDANLDVGLVSFDAGAATPPPRPVTSSSRRPVSGTSTARRATNR